MNKSNAYYIALKLCLLLIHKINTSKCNHFTMHKISAVSTNFIQLKIKPRRLNINFHLKKTKYL